LISYRPARADDASALAALARDTFVETFEHIYSPEDLASFLSAYKTPGALARWIADPSARIRLAEDGDRLAGYCIVSLASKLDYDAGGAAVADLDQLYILSPWQGQGIAPALMDWAIGEARAGGAEALILSVWQGNLKAQHVYRKYGFYEAGTAHFMVGEQRDDEFIYRLDLKA
jgi:diamine N-acetyltransferase